MKASEFETRKKLMETKFELKNVLRDLQDKNTRLKLLEKISFASDDIDERLN